MTRSIRREDCGEATPNESEGDMIPAPVPAAETERVLVISQDSGLFDQLREFISHPSNGHSFELVRAEQLGEAQAQLRHGTWYGIVLDLEGVPPNEDSAAYLRDWFAGAAARVPVLTILSGTGSFPLRIAALLDAVSEQVAARPLRREKLLDQLMALGNAHSSRIGMLDARTLRGGTIRLETRVPDLFPMLEELELAAAHDVTVLVVGETGSGKTTLAQLVHELSPRAGERFMHLACGALPPSLIESELFGHAKGAFTGADRNKVGRFEAVGKGTLLLDEIDSLTLDQQAKLLRVIETGEFEPVGSNETLRLEARLIVASNVSLETLVSNQRFRMDLYYRLNVLRFHLPPLRERLRDVVPLAMEFVDEVCRRCNVAIEGVHPQFIAAVKSYHWPGNIRELKNCMERAVILSRDVHLSPASLPPAVTQISPIAPAPLSMVPGRTAPRNASLTEKVASSEQSIIEEALRRHHNKRAPVARELGISRVTLYNKMRKYGLI